MVEKACKEKVLQDLVEMSRWLGEESRGFALFGEGNTSARVGDDVFLVKASGSMLGTITADQFVEMSLQKVLAVLDCRKASDEEIKKRMAEAMHAPSEYIPSVETMFHAYLLSIPGVSFVGHTHPVSVNAILCSKNWREITRGRLTPEEIASCGIAPAYIEYTDPGLPLARRIREVVTGYAAMYGIRPKAVLMQNHGLIALGSHPREVENVTAMWDKTARILAGTCHLGGPNCLSDKTVRHISSRPEIMEREKVILR